MIADAVNSIPLWLLYDDEVDEWRAAFPNKLLAAATIDRLRDGAYRVLLDGETRRRPRPLPAGPAAVSARPDKRTTTKARAAA